MPTQTTLNTLCRSEKEPFLQYLLLFQQLQLQSAMDQPADSFLLAALEFEGTTTTVPSSAVLTAMLMTYW